MISEPEWNSIRALAEKVATQVSGRRADYFQTGKVVKRDEDNRLVWLQGFANDPIPIVDFEHEVRYYDTNENGDVTVRRAIVSPVVPRVGQIVVVAYESGISRLPRCIGVLMGQNWIMTED